MSQWTFDSAFRAAAMAHGIAEALDLKLEIVSDWDPGVSITTVTLTDTERILAVQPRAVRWEKRFGVVDLPAVQVRLTNATLAILPNRYTKKWARLYFGAGGSWYPLVHGVISRSSARGNREAAIEIMDPIKLLLDAKLPQMEAWFSDTDDFNWKSTTRRNPNSGNFFAEHRPMKVEGDWDYPQTTLEGRTSTSPDLDAGAWPGNSTAASLPDRDVIWIEFMSASTVKFWSDEDATVDDNSAAGHSIESTITLTRDYGAGSITVGTIEPSGWNQSRQGGAYVTKTGDLYKIEYCKGKTGSGTYGDGRFNPVEVIREIITDHFALTRPTLTYGLDGSAESGTVLPLIPSGAADWQAAADAMATDSVQIRGSWEKGTSGLEMVQHALQAAMGGLWSGPDGSLRIALAAPTEGTAVTLSAELAANRSNVLSAEQRDAADDQVLRVVIEYRDLLSGTWSEEVVEDSGATAAELDQATLPIRLGWRMSAASAQRIGNYVLLRRGEIPTRYRVTTTLFEALDAEIFGPTSVIAPDAGVFSDVARVTEMAVDAFRNRITLDLVNEPLLEADQYARVDVDDCDDATKVVW